MPIYEFHCKECRVAFKTLCRSEQVATVTCPTCGTGRVARLLSVTAQTSTTDAMPQTCGAPGMGACCGMSPQGCGCRN